MILQESCKREDIEIMRISLNTNT